MLKTNNERQLLERILPFETKEISNSSIIHVGSHGYWDADSWEESGIIIDKNETLDNAAISSLCLNSKLVFLNMCEGARTLQNGLSTVDAFQSAGAEAIIGALWEIDDSMAVHISTSFYKKILEGQRISQALRESILAFRGQMEEAKSLNPIQWSAYQTYGQNLKLLDHTDSPLKRIASVTLSVCTSFSLLFYYFGHRIKSLILDYNLA
jgi:CHAT domain-containing protein